MSDRKPTNPFEGDHAKAFEAMAVASAFGITVATQAVGFWLSMMSGASAALRKEPALSDEKQPAPAPQAKPESVVPRKSAEIVELKSAIRRAKAKPGARLKLVTPTAKPAVKVGASKPSAAPALAPDDFRRPVALEKPAKPDDLKKIRGVGPKLEVTLNGLGIWTFAQIAALEPAEIAWLDDYLGLSGRIARDGWVETARAAGKTKTTDGTAKAGGDNG